MRTPLGLACAVLAALFLAVGAVAPDPRPEPAPAVQESGLFSHTRHVPSQWLRDGAEVPRDCRGCHDYSEPDPARRRRPQDTCVRCHGMQGMTANAPEGVRVDTTAVSLFDHYDHRERACQECHAPAGGEVPDVMPVPSLDAGALFCARCHGPEGEAASVRAEFNAGLDRRFEERAGDPPSTFRHDVHLTPEELASIDPAACDRCHVNLEDTDSTNLGELQFSVTGCETCHEGVTYETELYPRPSKSAATFVHHFHLGARAARENADIGGKRCGACHAWDEGARTFGLDPARFSGEDGHTGCATCHTDWAVEDHGSMNDCRECHDLSDGMIAGRPRVSVARPMPATFRITSQRHRFITGDVDADCSKCHLADLRELPSRVSGRAFDHATHLSPDRDEWQAECTRCHKTMAQALKPENVVGDRMWEWSHCESCHNTAAIEPVFEGEEPREVLRFSHLRHLGPDLPDRLGGEKITCVDCHVADPGDLSHGIGLQVEAAACTKCHDHEYADTTPYDLATVRSCAQCHRIGVPETDEPVPVERMRIAGADGIQRHRGDGACTQCHIGGAEDALAERGPHVFGITRDLPQPHQRSEHLDLGVHFEKIEVVGDPEPRTKWCLDCHWNRIKVTDPWVGPKQKQKWWKDGFRTESKWRKQYGSWMADYPGIDPR